VGITSRERPILFSAPMVRAILEGRKTQTRRVAKVHDAHIPGMISPDGSNCARTPQKHIAYCPYGQPGDRLWVRETFALQCDCDGDEPPFSDGRPVQREVIEDDGEHWLQPHYKASDETPDLTCEHEKCDADVCVRPWRPSIHMPRWASRITLDITGVRLERVQEISLDDCYAEGISLTDEKRLSQLRFYYATLWDSINAKRGFGWDKNPWVWVLEFKRIA